MNIVRYIIRELAHKLESRESDVYRIDLQRSICPSRDTGDNQTGLPVACNDEGTALREPSREDPDVVANDTLEGTRCCRGTGRRDGSWSQKYEGLGTRLEVGDSTVHRN